MSTARSGACQINCARSTNKQRDVFTQCSFVENISDVTLFAIGGDRVTDGEVHKSADNKTSPNVSHQLQKMAAPIKP